MKQLRKSKKIGWPMPVNHLVKTKKKKEKKDMERKSKEKAFLKKKLNNLIQKDEDENQTINLRRSYKDWLYPFPHLNPEKK